MTRWISLPEGSASLPEPKPASPAPTCPMGAGAIAATDSVRWRDGSFDMDFPAVPFPSRRVFAVAGERTLRAMVKRHHERLRDSSVGHLFPIDRERFTAGIERAADFVVAACGGPTGYRPADGETCMRTRHFAWTIDESAREVWLAQLLLAFDDVGLDEAVREEFWNWVEAMSVRMVNRRTMRAQPRRYPLAQAHSALSAFMVTRRRRVMCPR